MGGKQWPTNLHKLIRLLITSDGIVPVKALLERLREAAQQTTLNH
jgi:hypothetical protein